MPSFEDWLDDSRRLAEITIREHCEHQISEASSLIGRVDLHRRQALIVKARSESSLRAPPAPLQKDSYTKSNEALQAVLLSIASDDVNSSLDVSPDEEATIGTLVFLLDVADLLARGAARTA